MTVTNSLPHCKKCGLVEYDCHCEATDVPVAGANLARVRSARFPTLRQKYGPMRGALRP